MLWKRLKNVSGVKKSFKAYQPPVKSKCLSAKRIRETDSTLKKGIMDFLINKVKMENSGKFKIK
jgi:hypothetical protein